MTIVLPRSRTAVSTAVVMSRKAGMMESARKGRSTRSRRSILSDMTKRSGAKYSSVTIAQPTKTTEKSRRLYGDLKYCLPNAPNLTRNSSVKPPFRTISTFR